MIFKFLYTLCTIIGVNSHMQTPITMNNTMAITTTTSNTIEINIEEGDTMIRNLCNDFTPYIGENACAKTLFEVSQAVHFVTINKTNMILKPKSYDLTCYHDTSYAPHEEDISQCFPKTYQFTISALHLNNSQLITEKVYSITVKNISLSGTDKLILGALMLSSVSFCLVSCCLVEKKDSCFRNRTQVSVLEDKKMKALKIATAV
ncbi:MAG: hypothetical protein AAF900_01635 [Bacteroidota bacterium]